MQKMWRRNDDGDLMQNKKYSDNKITPKQYKEKKEEKKRALHFRRKNN